MQFLFWIIAILLSACAALWVFRTDTRRAIPYPWLTAALRGVVILLVALLILIPDVVISTHNTVKPVILLLQDNSQSAGIALGQDSTHYRTDMQSLLAKLQNDYRVVQWGFDGNINREQNYNYTGDATDITHAIDEAGNYYGMQNLGAVILASDGKFNQGLNPLYSQSAFQGNIYTVALGDSIREKDIRIARTYANKTAMLHSSFEVRADVIAERCNNYSGTATLKEGSNAIGSFPVNVAGARYDRTLSFTVQASEIGLRHYTISIPEAEGEKNLTNNKRDIFVEVVNEKKKILIASAAPDPDIAALREALADPGTYELTVVTADKMPASLTGYDAVILHGLPSPRYPNLPALKNLHTPTWFILTSHTDVAAMNGLKDLTHTGIAPQQLHEAPVNYRAAFNAFTVPQNIQAVSDKLPPLTSATGNIIAPPMASVLFTQRTPAGLMPAWVMIPGTTPAAILGGEGLWRWRLYEYRTFDSHEVVDECIRQTVAFLCANTKEKPFDITMSKHIWSDREPIWLNGYLLNANNEQINDAEVELQLQDSAGNKQPYTMERSGKGYLLNLGLRAGGRYTYTATTTYAGRKLSAAGSFAVESIPMELMENGADYDLLFKLAAAHNGAFVVQDSVQSLYPLIRNNKSITPIIETHSETVPLIARKWLFVIILCIAVAEWLLRKYWLAQ